MKYKQVTIFLAVCVLMVSKSAKSQITISRALCEHKINPVGVNSGKLFFSWEMQSDQEGVTQSAYELVIASTEEKLINGNIDVYNSGIIKSSQSIQVPYTGKQLQAGEIYYWKVRVWDNYQKQPVWSNVQQFTTGLFKTEDWKNARWIAFEDLPDSMRVVPFIHGKMKDNNPKKVHNAVSPLFRRQFSASKGIKKALFFISGLGHYEASINGRVVGNGFLTPGWTNYDKTALYNTYNVTGHLKEGDNTIGIVLGNGFYNISQERYVKGTGTFGKPKLIAVLKITYNDGSNEYIISDNNWKTSPSPTTFNNIYGGEDYDARLEQTGWNTNDFNNNSWKNALMVAPPRGTLLSEIDYPVMLLDSFAIKKTTAVADSIVVYDFGQNISGIPRIKIRGKAGQTVKIIPAELVDDNGKVNQADEVTPHYYTYTLKGDGEETWQPRFTYFAVRYIQIEGAVRVNKENDHNMPVLTDVQLLHNRNASPSNGSFACSNDLFNQIHTLIDRAVKSNLQSYITDNPQREKLSWQGEQNFMREAINYNYDVYNLYRSLVRNMMDAQHSNGLVPDIAPEYIQFEGRFVDSPEWGTTAILDMWFLYKFYGDTLMIRNAYDMMTRYARYLEKKATDNILNYGLGDWLDIGDVTPIGITATAYYYHSIHCLSEMADLINKKKDARFYRNLAEKIKISFNRKFFNEKNKTYGSRSQTSMAMPISLGLVDDKYKKDVLENLVSNIKIIDSNKLTAGDVGHRYLVKALYENGHSNILYDMTNRDDVPGYGYLLKKGATALVETWDGRFSQNQLAMGHILEWFHGGIAGISQMNSSVAFKYINIHPRPAGNLTWAKGTYHSPYGWIKSEWTKASGLFTINLTIPVNTRASVHLPATGSSKIYKNGKQLSIFKFQHETAIIELGSGQYQIKIEE